jgi:hypothetical protein
MSDQNESDNSRSPNSLSSIEDIAESLASTLKTPSMAVKELRRKIQVDAYVSTLDPNSFSPNSGIAKQIEKSKSATATNTTRVRIATHGTIRSANRQFTNKMQSSFSDTEINRIAREEQYSPEANARTQALSGLSGLELLERQQSLSVDANSLRRDVRKTTEQGIFGMRTVSDASHIGRKDILNKLEAANEQKQNIGLNMAAVNQEMQRRKALGIDPKSQQETLFANQAAAANQVGMQNIINNKGFSVTDPGGASRHVGLGAEAVKELTAQFSALAKASAELTHVSESERTAKLAEIETINKNVEAVKSGIAAGGGGSRMGMSASGWSKVANIAQMVGTAGQLIGDIGVNQEIQRVRNTGAYANIENQKYAMYQAARQGDIASQEALYMTNSAQHFAGRIKATAGFSETLTGVGSGVSQIAGGLATNAAAVGVNAAPVIGQIASVGLATAGTGMMVSGGATLASTATSVFNGVGTGQSYKAGFDAYMATLKEVNAIPAAQKQGLRDLYTNSAGVSLGMGSAGTGYLNEITGADVRDRNMMAMRHGEAPIKTLLQKMTDANISPEQMAQMSQLGVGMMGSQFNTSQVLATRNYEKLGLGDMATNMGRMGQLSAAGANNPQAGLENILAAATQKGLDSSVALKTMTDNTAAMVRDSSGAAIGLNVHGVVAAQQLSMVDKGDPRGEFNLARAAGVLAISHQDQTNTSTTFSGMMNTARVSQTLGVSGIQAQLIGKQDAAFFTSLKEKAGLDPNKARMMLLKTTGVDVAPNEVGAWAGKAVSLKQRQVAEGGGMANAIFGGLDEDIYQKIIKGEALSSDTVNGRNEMGMVAQIASSRGLKGGADDLINAIRAAGVGSSTNTLEKPSTDPNDIKNVMDNLRTDGFKQLSEAAGNAATTLEKVGGALSYFAQLQQNYSKNGAANEEYFAGAGASAAADFKAGNAPFSQSVNRFTQAVEILAKKAGMPNVASQTPDPNADKGVSYSSAGQTGRDDPRGKF